jgi:CxxC-x17-CxxC domain-containing protein
VLYTDRAISCADCGEEFTFSAGEQEFYAQRGFTEPPKRCPSCRARRKAQRNGPGFEGGQGASTGSSGGYGSGYGDRPARQMHEAVCDQCGRTALVPFVPTGARPVYCSDCFQSRR